MPVTFRPLETGLIETMPNHLESHMTRFLIYVFPILRRLGAALALTIATPALQAQTTDPETPASSPLWWTLSEDVSPQELRRSFRDHDVILKHYSEALDQGSVASYSPEQLEYLSYFHSGALHPELLPMWEAFDAFALRFRYREEWSDRASRELRRYGVSEAGSELISSEAQEHLQVVDLKKLELGSQQRDFVELMKSAADVMGKPAAKQALRNRDASTLARALGKSANDLRRLLIAWETDPTAVSAKEVLPRLKDKLSAEDWESLRRYLLAEVAPHTSAIDFDDPEAIP